MIRILKITTNKIVIEKDIEGDLKSLQSEVGGLITRVPYFDELTDKYIDIYADDEGLLKADPITTLIKAEGNKIINMLVGNLIFTGYNDDGETLGLTDEQLAFILAHLEMVEVKGRNTKTDEDVSFKCFTFKF